MSIIPQESWKKVSKKKQDTVNLLHMNEYGARRPRAAGLAAIETPVGGEGQDQRLKGWQGAWPSNRCLTSSPGATRPLLTGSAPRPPQGAPAQEGGDRRLKQV